jgi:hypothetical protein
MKERVRENGNGQNNPVECNQVVHRNRRADGNLAVNVAAN